MLKLLSVEGKMMLLFIIRANTSWHSLESNSLIKEALLKEENRSICKGKLSGTFEKDYSSFNSSIFDWFWFKLEDASRLMTLKAITDSIEE
jgi:hypothetical protein